MTDVSNLDDLANEIASSSTKIKAYAKAQAAATQSQETAIADALARLDALEVPAPPPPPPPPPPPSTRKGLVFLRYGSSAPPPSHDGVYDALILSNASLNRSSLISPNLGYTSGIRCHNSYPDHGFSAAECRARGFVLKDAAGTELRDDRWDGTSVLADIGSPAYQLAWCQAVEARVRRVGNDGIFVDDYNRVFWLSNRTAAKYPTGRSQENAAVSFLAFVHSYFSARGIYVIPNVSGYTPDSYTDMTPGDSANGVNDYNFWTKLCPYMDGGMSEGFQFKPYMRQHWANWQRLIPLANSYGVDFLGFHWGTPAERDFSLCSFLLEFDGRHGSFAWVPGSSQYASDPWNATYDKVLALGAPLGPAVNNERRFANGIVRVNQAAGTASIS